VKQLSIWTKLYLGMIAFSLMGTLLTALTDTNPEPVKPVASLLTIAFGFISIARAAHWGYALAVLLVGAAAEICGVFTGYPFGRYEYTDRWWPTLELSQGHVFPVLVPFAWFLVAGGCSVALKPIGKASLVFAPIVATLIDFFMEPVMVRVLGYWRWIDSGPLPGGAPWMNAVGWFATSLAAAWILGKPKSKNPEDAAWVVIGFVVLLAGFWLIHERLTS
jgi:uncharacterized membrane protein